jgi:hypothetical protein
MVPGFYLGGGLNLNGILNLDRSVYGDCMTQPRNRRRTRPAHVSLQKSSKVCKPTFALTFAFALAVLLAGPQRLSAQMGQRSKLPGLNKITSNGATHQAFTGKIQSLDRKHDVLSVNTIEGVDTEIFPIKKRVKVMSANGLRLQLAALKPGTSVTVFYNQKGDRRTVNQIVVLSDILRASTKKEHHPS